MGEIFNLCVVFDCCECGWFFKKLVENFNILFLRIFKFFFVRESFGEVIRERVIYIKL